MSSSSSSPSSGNGRSLAATADALHGEGTDACRKWFEEARGALLGDGWFGVQEQIGRTLTGALSDLQRTAVEALTTDELLTRLKSMADKGSEHTVYAPAVRGRKGTYEKLFTDFAKQGFARVRVDGTVHELADITGDTPLELARYETHDIDVIVEALHGAVDAVGAAAPQVPAMSADDAAVDEAIARLSS